MLLLIKLIYFRLNESLSVVCTELADRWANSSDGSEFSHDDLEGFSSTQIQEFLNKLLNKVSYQPPHEEENIL